MRHSDNPISIEYSVLRSPRPRYSQWLLKHCRYVWSGRGSLSTRWVTKGWNGLACISRISHDIHPPSGVVETSFQVDFGNLLRSSSLLRLRTHQEQKSSRPLSMAGAQTKWQGDIGGPGGPITPFVRVVISGSFFPFILRSCMHLSRQT